MDESQDSKKSAATTQIASLLVIAEQLAAITGWLQQQAEATRQQNDILDRIATALETKGASK